jgi:hypothetical protein
MKHDMPSLILSKKESSGNPSHPLEIPKGQKKVRDELVIQNGGGVGVNQRRISISIHFEVEWQKL